jgi:hypothetical protein
VLEEMEIKEKERKQADSQTTPLLQFMKDRKVKLKASVVDPK